MVGIVCFKSVIIATGWWLWEHRNFIASKDEGGKVIVSTAGLFLLGDCGGFLQLTRAPHTLISSIKFRVYAAALGAQSGMG